MRLSEFWGVKYPGGEAWPVKQMRQSMAGAGRFRAVPAVSGRNCFDRGKNCLLFLSTCAMVSIDKYKYAESGLSQVHFFDALTEHFQVPAARDRE